MKSNNKKRTLYLTIIIPAILISIAGTIIISFSQTDIFLIGKPENRGKYKTYR